MVTIGERIRSIRNKNISQQELADALHVNRSAILYETNRKALQEKIPIK